MDSLFSVINFFTFVLYFFATFWWIYVPVVLFFAVVASYLAYTRAKYIASLKWVMLDLKVPQDTRKSPNATEQIFAALHAVSSKVKFKDSFWKGKVADWFSFEIVSAGGDIHFYIRTLESNRNLVEAQIYAQYPEAEITEAVDYINQLPASLPDEQNDLTGGQIVLTKEDVYPIKTYPEFEEKSPGKEDLKRIDPLASLAESLSQLVPGEFLGLQLLIRSADDKWVKKAEPVINKLMGKKPKFEPGIFGKSIFWVDSLIFSAGAGEKKEEKENKLSDLTPGKQDTIKAIEKSTFKLGFNSGIRFIYIAEKPKFNKGRQAGVVGAFKQFSSPTLNGFKAEGGPKGKWPFKAQQEYKGKVEIWNNFKKRNFPSKSYVLNTEELATIFHFPDIGVEGPLPRIEAKKGEPPAGLPIS